MESVQPGKKYRHFKGNEYKVLGVGKHTETGEDFVVYQSPEGGQVWIRPVQIFFEVVERQGKQVPRFVLVETR